MRIFCALFSLFLIFSSNNYIIRSETTPVIIVDPPPRKNNLKLIFELNLLKIDRIVCDFLFVQQNVPSHVINPMKYAPLEALVFVTIRVTT